MPLIGANSVFKKVLTVSLLILFQTSIAQDSNKVKAGKQFKQLSRPEKWWVYKHFFVARKCWKLTREAKQIAEEMKRSGQLDGDANGGQVDAFRHAYWMALLTQHVNWRKARRLGRAHEKGNYLSFKKGRTEDGTLPDKAGSDMDHWNNAEGIRIGRKMKAISRDSLQSAVIAAIRDGRMRVLKKNKEGGYLDCNGKLIAEEALKGKWTNDKCLVSSDQVSA